jgi:anti-repressor protein
LSCDAFKQFCLLAETESGRQTRQYFIEAEKKWRIVQQVSPQIAEEVEVLAMRIELAKLEAQRAASEAQKAVLEDRTIGLRHLIVTTQPKAIADRILGVTEIQGQVQTRTVVVDQIGNVVNAGDTLTKTQIAHELGFTNTRGKAETKQVAALVDEAIAAGAIPIPWREERTVIATGFDASLMPKLKAFYQMSPKQRQRWVGE